MAEPNPVESPPARPLTEQAGDGLPKRQLPENRPPTREELADYLKRYEDASEALQKFTMLGNAGGAIASLSLIGTVLARSPDRSYPFVFLIALVIFVAGLVGNWAVLLSRTRSWGWLVQHSSAVLDIIGTVRHAGGPENEEIDILRRRSLRAPDRFERIGNLISIIALGTGGVTGLAALIWFAR